MSFWEQAASNWMSRISVKDKVQLAEYARSIVAEDTESQKRHDSKSKIKSPLEEIFSDDDEWED
ncbi:hypothetical protein [Paenibacillus sp. GP183]|uniref:hypothetical protein n=1 Tax=Paenibacillus sp. GP183 TaxID=1882751 RepID=UPI0008952AA1|nr:hypothetical protein [Paenibacillus sp. GP183]SED14480.1 hypothetical protein SAMN05443246_5891 [Paenibacillus sp. GP183]